MYCSARKPSNVSNLTGIKVIFEFRNNDIYHGGQGAPLAPIYHRYLLEEIKAELPSCVLNIGGIANLTFWDGIDLIGFDTGPGNILMDTFFKKNFTKILILMETLHLLAFQKINL